MPYVKVELAGSVTAEQKRAIHRGMTDVLVNVLGKNPEYTFVVIQEFSTDNWGRKGESLTKLWSEAPATPEEKPARKPSRKARPARASAAPRRPSARASGRKTV